MKARIHNLKTWPEPFAAVIEGRKRFEFRKDDRGYAVGDVLNLLRWDPSPSNSLGNVGFETREWTTVRVTYLTRGFGVPDGFVCMGIEPVAEPIGDTPMAVRWGTGEGRQNDRRDWRCAS